MATKMPLSLAFALLHVWFTALCLQQAGGQQGKNNDDTTCSRARSCYGAYIIMIYMAFLLVYV